MRTFISIFQLFLFLLLTGCHTGVNQNQLAKASKDAKMDTIEKVIYLLPSPEEMLNDIFTHGITLDPELVNPKSNEEKYIDEKMQGINLGVYITDFAYLNLNNNKADALEYFKIIKDLAVKLNIYGFIDESVFDRINKNLMNNDSLIQIMSDVYYNVSDILETSGRENIYALISTGAIIETLYLSVMCVTKYSDYQSVVYKIFRKKQIFDSYFTFISDYKDDKNIRSVLQQMIKLKSILDLSVVDKQVITVKKDGVNHFSVKSKDKITITEKMFSDFKANVIVARLSITHPSNN